MSRFLHLLRTHKTRKESGNTLIMFMMLFPVIMSVFGLSLDVSIAKFVDRSLSTSMTASVQGAVSQATTVASNVPIIDKNGKDVKRLYAYNTGRSGKGEYFVPFVICQKEAVVVKKAYGSSLYQPPSMKQCGWTEPELTKGKPGSFTYKNNARIITISYTAVEISDTIFLQFLGIDELQHQVTATSSTSYSSE